MQKLLPMLGRLLNKCDDSQSVLNEDDSILLQLITQKYTADTAVLLRAESPSWKTLLRVMSLTTSVFPGHPAPIITALSQVRIESLVCLDRALLEWIDRYRNDSPTQIVHLSHKGHSKQIGKRVQN